MAILNILKYPDPRLRRRADPVERVDDEVRSLAADMLETMYAAPGIGLAATQVDVHRRVLVADVSSDSTAPMCLINPELMDRHGSEITEEGCLSVPGAFDKVERANHVRVRALDLDGRPVEIEAEGLLAICIQHEIDHLNGKLFVDYLSELKRQRIRKRLEKERKLGGDEEPRARAAAPVI
ncbi:MAG TPA: peptide deformylase [Gammaproteobacteria bacterium]|nr:peptide deformylase [Gammaproteobacteria bacterium]